MMKKVFRLSLCDIDIKQLEQFHIFINEFIITRRNALISS